MMKTNTTIAAILVSGILALFGTTAALAEGGKNRLGNEDIEEGYQLCLKGVETVTLVDEDGTVVVINCEEVPEPGYE